MSEEEKPTETTTTEVPKVETPKEEESTAHFEPVVRRCALLCALSLETWLPFTLQYGVHVAVAAAAAAANPCGRSLQDDILGTVRSP
jgi:hypothetical protein